MERRRSRSTELWLNQEEETIRKMGNLVHLLELDLELEELELVPTEPLLVELELLELLELELHELDHAYDLQQLHTQHYRLKRL